MWIEHTLRPGLSSAGICDSASASCYCNGKYAPTPLAPPPPPLLLSSGICDSATASCYCDGKYGYIPPPLGSPPGTPPIRPGRMLGDHCLPNQVRVLSGGGGGAAANASLDVLTVSESKGAAANTRLDGCLCIHRSRGLPMPVPEQVWAGTSKGVSWEGDITLTQFR